MRNPGEKRIKIHVRLLGEGTDCMRLTEADEVDPGVYRLLACDDYDPDDEHWEYPPGSLVGILAIVGKPSSVATSPEGGRERDRRFQTLTMTVLVENFDKAIWFYCDALREFRSGVYIPAMEPTQEGRLAYLIHRSIPGFELELLYGRVGVQQAALGDLPLFTLPVQDCMATLGELAKLGIKPVGEVHDSGNQTQATIQDPSGNRITLYSRKR